MSNTLGSGSADVPEVSVVVPVYNERDNIEPLFAEIAPILDAAGRRYEVILVDDGSTDGSAETLSALKHRHPAVRVLTFESNAGQTAAMAAGFAAARGPIVLTMDADLQNDPHDIPMLLEVLETCDAVVGWRAKRADTWVRRVSSRIANGVRNALSDDDIIDTGCSLKAYRREALARIKLFNGMHRFLPTLLRMEGFEIRQVQVNHRPRRAGDSKYNIRNRVFRSFIDLLAVRWMKRRMIRYKVEERP